MNRRLLFATTLLLSGFSLGGCSLYDEGRLGPDCSDDALACGCPGRPPCPVTGTSSEMDAMTISFAMTEINLDQQGGEWETVGFNLDGFISTSENGYAGDCTPYSPVGSPAPTLDGVGGIDNQFGSELWSLIETTLPTLECEVNWAHARGQGTLIMTVEKWNGTADDDEVTVSIVPALDGTSAATDCSTWNGNTLRNAGDTADAPDPNLNDNVEDNFCVNPYGLVGQTPGNNPTVTDTRAYIADGGIMMTLIPGARFQLFSTRSSVNIALNQGSLFAQMNDDFTRLQSGFASGRMDVNTLQEIGPEIGVCHPEDFVDTYRETADILSIQTDNPDGTDECDALSIGVGFKGVLANVAGDALNSVEPFAACDPVTDTIVEPWPVYDCCVDETPSRVMMCQANTTLP